MAAAGKNLVFVEGGLDGIAFGAARWEGVPDGEGVPEGIEEGGLEDLWMGEKMVRGVCAEVGGER